MSVERHPQGQGRIGVESFGPDDALGWSWIVPPHRWHLDARALESLRAAAVDAAALRRGAEADPVFGSALMPRVSATVLERLGATSGRPVDSHGSGTPTGR